MIAALLLDAMLLGTFSIWLGCLFVTCMLLDTKGRSALGGFFAYLLFPIGALIYAAAVPPIRPPDMVNADEFFARLKKI